MTIVPLLASWLVLPVGAVDRPFEGSVVCGNPCGAQRASDGRWILTLVTDALGPPPRPVTLDVTDVIRDLPRIEPGDFLSVVADDVPSAQGRYLVRSLNKPRDGQETSDREEQPDPENEDNAPSSVGAPRPPLSLTLSSSTLAEGGGSTILTVGLSSPRAQAVTVTLTFTGSATDGVDYIRPAGSTTVTIPANTLSVPLTLTAIQDPLIEGNETIAVAIASATNATIGSPSSVTATIVDDDAAPGVPTVQWTAAAQTVAEGVVAQVSAQLSAVTTRDVTVPFTIGGTATPTTDFTTTPAPPTSLTIPAGSTSASVTVTVIDDGIPEPDEPITFTMGTPTNATRGTTFVHTVTISGSGETAPIVSATTPDGGATNVGIQSSVTITFNEPVTVTGSWFEIACATSGTRTVASSAVSGGPTAFTIDPNTDFAVGEQCTATVFATQVNDDDLLDPPDTMAANHVFSFTTADAAPTVSSTSPANSAANVAVDTTITINFSEPVTYGTGSFTIDCGGARTFSLAGGSTSTQAILDPTNDLPGNTLCTVTVVASQVTDNDLVDPPGAMAANYVFSFTTAETAPFVTSTTPANGATNVPNDTSITVNFSEPVNFGTGSFVIECPFGMGSVAFTVSGDGTSTAVLDPTANLPAGLTCTVSANSSQMTDVDALDPPNFLVPNGDDANGRPAYVFSFTTVDAAPMVTSTTPANGATNVSNDTNITINLSEPVSFGTSSFAIECPPGAGSVAFTVSGNGTSTAVLDPTASLPVGVTCTVSVTSSQVTDVDTFDPPNFLVPNGEDANGRPAYVFSFTTVDAAPSVTSTTPANGATNVPSDTNIAINFSEPVNFGSNAFAVECPVGSGSVAFSASGSGTSTTVIDPTVNLPANVTCTVSVTSSHVTDVDLFDPPSFLVPNGNDANGRPAYQFSFSTVADAAPSVTSTTPTNGATNVPNDTNITITFSEPVNFGPSSFTIQCPSGSDSVAFSVSGDGTSTAVLDPTANLPAGVTCTVSAISARVTDVDAFDPPNTLVPNGEDADGHTAYLFSFTTVDAAPMVTSTTPANGATNVLIDTSITISFSEPVNFDETSFTIQCPFGSDSVAFGVSGTSTSTAVLDPTDTLPANVTCTVSVISARVTDVDTSDPPDSLVPNSEDGDGRSVYQFSFTTAGP